jgi:hypothetical protein
MLVWEGDKDFRESLEQVVLKPYTQPDVFHPLLNPIRHLALVYGRPGVGKKEAVLAFCTKHSIPTLAVDVVFGQASHIMTHLGAAIRKQTNAIADVTAQYGTPETDTIDHVIVIDKFDVLLFEPDTEAVMSYVLDLDRLAQSSRALFVCLSDRLPSEEAATPVAHMTRLYRDRALAQFKRASIMLRSPSIDHRTALFKSLLEAFVAHQRSVGVDVSLSLTDGDYTKLSDASMHATSADIATFLKAIFYKIASDNPPVLCRPADAPMDPQTGKPTGPMLISWNVLDENMFNTTNSRNILKNDPRHLEDMYNIEATGMPLPRLKEHVPAAASMINATGFSKSMVKSENAAGALKSAASAKRAPKRERADDEIDAYWKEEETAKNE